MSEIRHKYSTSVYKWDKTIRCLSCPSLPLLPKLLPEHCILLRNPAKQVHSAEHAVSKARETHDSPDDRIAQAGLGEVALGAREQQEVAGDYEDPPGVARVPYERVRPPRDELVVVLHGHLPGEEFAECAMTPYPDAPSHDPEQQPGTGRGRNLQRCHGVCSGGREKQRGEDAVGVRLREAVCEEHYHLGDGGPAQDILNEEDT